MNTLYENHTNASSGESQAAILVKDGKTYVWMPGITEPLRVIEGYPLLVRVDVPGTTSSDVVLRTIVTRETDG